MKALRIPETIEELNEINKFMEVAKTTGYQELVERIKALVLSMTFLLDTQLFPKEDLDLNTQVLLWPQEIQPIFDQNEEIIVHARAGFENHLFQKRDKLLIEIEKIQNRIDEFTDYGELEMMKQYVDDIKIVQKRIHESENLIEWIRNEEAHFKMPLSEFPLLDAVKNNLDPFNRLFNTVYKWQRNEKKWNDGAFLDLNSESVEAECEEFWKEIYKIQKQFMSIVKKRKMELNAKLGEKRKSKSKLINIFISYFFLCLILKIV